jgi:hypothetical protein
MGEKPILFSTPMVQAILRNDWVAAYTFRRVEK